MSDTRWSAPRVTWCIAAKDAEDTIGEALRGILEQTFEDFEVLVVDDGSTDATAQVAEGIGDHRVRVIRLPRNVGRGAARNIALENARGEYFAINDADDVSLPARLSLQVQHLDRNPRTAAVGGHVVNVDQGRLSESNVAWPETPDASRREVLRGRMPLAHCAAVFRTDVMRKYRGYSPECVRAQDYELVLRMIPEWDIVNLPDVVLHYGRPRNPPLRYWLENYRYHRYAEARAAAVNAGLQPPLPDTFASGPRRALWRAHDTARWCAMRVWHAARGVD